MHAHNISAARNANRHGCGCPFNTFVRRQIQRVADETFARRPQQNGASERTERIQAVNQF